MEEAATRPKAASQLHSQAHCSQSPELPLTKGVHPRKLAFPCCWAGGVGGSLPSSSHGVPTVFKEGPVGVQPRDHPGTRHARPQGAPFLLSLDGQQTPPYRSVLVVDMGARRRRRLCGPSHCTVVHHRHLHHHFSPALPSCSARPPVFPWNPLPATSRCPQTKIRSGAPPAENPPLAPHCPVEGGVPLPSIASGPLGRAPGFSPHPSPHTSTFCFRTANPTHYPVFPIFRVDSRLCASADRLSYLLA